MKFLEALSQQGEHKLTSSLVRVLAVKRRASKNLVERSETRAAERRRAFDLC
jgi:hypothetical protein